MTWRYEEGGIVWQALDEGSKPDEYMAYDGSTALVMAVPGMKSAGIAWNG